MPNILPLTVSLVIQFLVLSSSLASATCNPESGLSLNYVEPSSFNFSINNAVQTVHISPCAPSTFSSQCNASFISFGNSCSNLYEVYISQNSTNTTISRTFSNSENEKVFLHVTCDNSVNRTSPDPTKESSASSLYLVSQVVCAGYNPNDNTEKPNELRMGAIVGIVVGVVGAVVLAAVIYQWRSRAHEESKFSDV